MGARGLHTLSALYICTHQTGLCMRQEPQHEEICLLFNKHLGKIQIKEKEKLLKKCFLLCVNPELFKSQNNIICYRVMEVHTQNTKTPL